MRDAEPDRDEHHQREECCGKEQPLRRQLRLPAPFGERREVGVRDDLRRACVSGANEADVTNESISQRLPVCLKTAVTAIGPSVSFGAGWKSSSTLTSCGYE